MTGLPSGRPFVDMLGARLSGGAVVVVTREGVTVGGRAYWRIRWTACGHEHLVTGANLRQSEKLGRARACPVCKPLRSHRVGPPAHVVDEQAREKDRARNRRKHVAQKATIGLNRLPLKERRHLAFLTPPLTHAEESLRPKTRGACAAGLRPCPWVSCRHHLFLEVLSTGNITLPFPDLEPDAVPATCSLDVADTGATTHEELGLILNVTRERARQLEGLAIDRVRDVGRRILDLDMLASLEGREV